MSTTASETSRTSTVIFSLSSATTPTAGETVQVATTITSASATCVATLQARILDNGSTALIANTAGTGYVTLNETCSTQTTSTTSTSANARITAVTTAYRSEIPTSTPSPQSHTKLSGGMIAGIVLAMVAILAVVCSVSFLLWRRNRRWTCVRIGRDLPLKDFDDDEGDEVSSRWEKDGAEINELSSCSALVEADGAEAKEMSSGRGLVETNIADREPVMSFARFKAKLPPVLEIDENRSVDRSPAKPRISPIEQLSESISGDSSEEEECSSNGRVRPCSIMICAIPAYRPDGSTWET